MVGVTAVVEPMGPRRLGAAKLATGVLLVLLGQP